MTDQMEEFRIGSFALPAESEEQVVSCNHSYVEVCVLQIHAGHPLMWMHDSYDRLQSLYLENRIENQKNM